MMISDMEIRGETARNCYGSPKKILLLPTKGKAVHPSKAPPGSIVYILDDDQSVRISLSRALRVVGLTVETFASAHEFCDRDAHDGPSCLVLEARMPGFDGLELQREFGNREAPFIFLTRHGDIPTYARAMKAGAVDFLTKPAKLELLLTAVYRALDRSVEACNG
jgi:FixJ family two-component response regulator